MSQAKEAIRIQERLKYKWYGKRILVVEDISVNHMLIDRILRKTRAQVLWAMNGKKAVDMVREDKNIDLILMDIRMPVMDGYEATRKIREIRTDVPIIAQTAYVLEDEKDKVLDVGCNDLITRPLRKESLLEKIHTYLSNGH